MLNRRNAKILALGAALMLALPAVASAQMSRVEGMALQGDFLKDWSGIFTYTSQVSNVGNLVYGELGNVESPPETFDRSVGVVIGNLWEGRLGTWSIHLREQTPQLGQGDAAPSQPGADSLGFDPNVNTSEAFDIMWGKKFGTKSIGLRVNRSNAQYLEEIGATTFTTDGDFTIGPGADLNQRRNVLGFGAGFGMEMSPTTNLEFALLYQKRDWMDEVTGPGTLRAEEEGSKAYQIAARAMYQWQPNIMLVPVFKWYDMDLGNKAFPATAAPDSGVKKNSRDGWQLGVAGNWTLGSNDLFVLGINFGQNKLKQEEDLFVVGGPLQPAYNDTLDMTETFMPQLFAALETHVNSWLTVRFGANKGAYHKVTIEAPNGDKIERSVSNFNMRLGAGIKIGNLQLDAIVSDAFPNTLPYFISGTPTTDLFTKVTATYPF